MRMRDTLTLPVTLGIVYLDFLTEQRGQVKRVEGVLGLIVVLELNETVALGQPRIEINRYDDVNNVAEAAELVQQIFPSLLEKFY